MSTEPLVAKFTEAINNVVDTFRDEGITISEVLGSLDLVHAQIIKEAMDNDRE